MRVKVLWVLTLLVFFVVGIIFSSGIPPGDRVPPGMVLVEGGIFIMGTDEDSSYQPPHEVTLEGFYIGKYEVTQKEWRAVMGNNPSSFIGENNPVEGIDWYSAIEYCNKRSEKEGLTPCYSKEGKTITCNFEADGYRLPKEAEWEYACRGGVHSRDYIYSGSNKVEEVTWFEENSGGKPHPVGQKRPNELGLYDMSGNIWEWCWDLYDEKTFKNKATTFANPDASGKNRFYRGGGCNGRKWFNRSTARFNKPPDFKNTDMGLRVVKNAVGKLPEGMVAVEGGTFKMGSTEKPSGQGPAHRVTVNDFFIGKCEITQEEWAAVMGINISWFSGARHPVDCVSWYKAVEYCNKRSKMEGLTPCYSGSGDKITCDFNADGYRLPTEAEWEYAYKGGNQSRNYKFSGANNPDQCGWYVKSLRGFKPRPVGAKKPNELGIFDMSGNVWEWCWDRYDRYYFRESPGNNPKGPPTGIRRTMRSGSVYNPPQTPFYRNAAKPFNGFYGYGFRVVRTVK